MLSVPGKIFILFIFFLLPFFPGIKTAVAQTPHPVNINWDTNYYVSYAEKLTTRIYTSTKYTSQRYLNLPLGKNLLYTPNNNIILGVGATYSVFTLNIGLDFPFINAIDTAQRGYSGHLDLQSHLYTKKVTLDLYAQFYSGFYLRNSANVLQNWPQTDTFYIRPDLTVYSLGWNAQYIFNYRKFSYRSVYNQNEWQKKSAGSWILGANMFYTVNVGDSLIVPSNIDPPDLFYNSNFKRKDALNIGISGGYYYNFVFAKNFFFSVGFAGGPGIGYSWLNINENLPMQYSGLNLSINGVFRTALGYNSPRVWIGTFYLNQFVINDLPIKSTWSNFSTGNFRIIAVYRFTLKKPMKLVNVRYWDFLYKDDKEKKKKKE